MTKRLTETTAQMDRAIGSRIRNFRTSQGLSQSVLAEKVGVSFQQIQKYENGRNRVAASTLTIIAKALQVNPLALLGLEPSEIESTAFVEMTQRCRDLELRMTRARRALGSDDDVADNAVSPVERDRTVRMQAA